MKTFKKYLPIFDTICYLIVFGIAIWIIQSSLSHFDRFPEKLTSRSEVRFIIINSVMGGILLAYSILGFGRNIKDFIKWKFKISNDNQIKQLEK